VVCPAATAASPRAYASFWWGTTPASLNDVVQRLCSPCEAPDDLAPNLWKRESKRALDGNGQHPFGTRIAHVVGFTNHITGWTDQW
jgi:hypothetical protein